MHDEQWVLLVGIVVVAGRVVDAADPAVVQQFRGN